MRNASASLCPETLHIVSIQNTQYTDVPHLQPGSLKYQLFRRVLLAGVTGQFDLVSNQALLNANVGHGWMSCTQSTLMFQTKSCSHAHQTNPFVFLVFRSLCALPDLEDLTQGCYIDFGQEQPPSALTLLFAGLSQTCCDCQEECPLLILSPTGRAPASQRGVWSCSSEF